jgi:hypothetical protein
MTQVWRPGTPSAKELSASSNSLSMVFFLISKEILGLVMSLAAAAISWFLFFSLFGFLLLHIRGSHDDDHCTKARLGSASVARLSSALEVFFFFFSFFVLHVAFCMILSPL